MAALAAKRQTAAERAVELEEAIEQTQREAADLADAWQAWDEFNRALHFQDPPAELVEGWDRIRAFLESRAGTITATLRELEDEYCWLLK